MTGRKSTGQPKVRKAAKARTDPGPVTSRADLSEHVAPARGAGPTRAGGNTPVPSARTVPAAIKDKSSAATGTTIFQKAALHGKHRIHGENW